MADNLYTLNLKDTPSWASYDDDPDKFPNAGRIQAYLEENGVIFSRDGGIQVFTDGTIQITSITNPEPAFKNFGNEPSTDELAFKRHLTLVRTIANRPIAPTDAEIKPLVEAMAYLLAKFIPENVS